MSISSVNYNMIRYLIPKLLSIKESFLPSYYLTTKHRVPLITGEVKYTDKYLHLLPKLDMNKIVVSDDPNNYEGKKFKISKKYFAIIKGRYEKVYHLITEIVRRKITNFETTLLIVFNLHNSANNLETSKSKIDLVFFSSTIANYDLLALLPTYLKLLKVVAFALLCKLLLKKMPAYCF